MKRILTGFLLSLIGAAALLAQSTTVSGTVTDAGTQTWNNGSYSFSFVPVAGYAGPYSWTGGTFNPLATFSGTLDSGGAFSKSVPSNSAITPAGSTWNLKVCPQGDGTCYTQSVIVTGSTQTVNPAPPAISVTAANAGAVYATVEVANGKLGSVVYVIGTGLENCTVVTSGSCSTWAAVGGGGGSGTVAPGTIGQPAVYTAATTVGSSPTLTAAITDKGGQVYNVKAYGAVGTQYSNVWRADGTVTAASTAFTSATGTFASGDVGKTIFIYGAGPTAPSTNGSATGTGGGGAIPCGITVYFKISYLNARGESAGSAEGTQATGGCGTNNNTVTITSPTAGSQSAMGWVLYASTTTNQEVYQPDTGCASEVGIGCAIGTNWTLTRVNTAGASPLTAATSSFETTIAARGGATAITLTDAAQTAVSGVTYWYGTDDTPAIQSAMNACGTATGGVVFFPTGQYAIGSPIIWQGGCRMDASAGKGTGAGTLAALYWAGRSGGMMFLSPHTGNVPFYTEVQNLIFAGNTTHSVWPTNFFFITDRADWGLTFNHFQFGDSVGDGLILDRGATNFLMYDFRTDSLANGYVVHSISTGDTLWLHDFTADNQNHGQGGGTAQQYGIVGHDGSEGGGMNSITIENAHIEDNSGYGSSHPAVIYDKIYSGQTSVSDYIGLADVWIPSTGANAFNMVYEDTAATFDPMLVNWRNVNVSSWPVGAAFLGGTKNLAPAANWSYPSGTFGGSNSLCCSDPDAPFNSMGMINELTKVNGDTQGTTVFARLPDANRIRFYDLNNTFAFNYYVSPTTYTLMQMGAGSLAYYNSPGSYTATLTWPSATASLTLPSGTGTIGLLPGSLTNTALVTAAGANTLQTPAATATMDSSGNISTPGTITSASLSTSGATAGYFQCTQGSANGHATATTITDECPASVTAYEFVRPGAAATGIPHWSNSANVVTGSVSAIVGADMTNNTVTATQLAAQYSKGSCTEVWGGSGTSFAMQAGDDAISNNSCYNDSGVTRTITAVKCRADNASNTTVLTPTFGSAGTGTAILTGTVTCGNSYAYSATGTLNNTAWTTGTGIDPGMSTVGNATSVAMIVEFTY